MCGAFGAHASECTGTDCEFIEVTPEQEYIVPTTVSETTYIDTTANTSAVVPMRNVKMLSIKPVAPDNRPPVYDGTNGKYKPRGFPKTVDWRDGIPIWDDSISDYNAKDFHDWMLEPLPEAYMRGTNNSSMVGMYNDTMNDAATTRARIEELLIPNCPCADAMACNSGCASFKPNARYTAQDLSRPIRKTFGDDGCPFETETECNIWRRKPIIREIVSPRAPKIRNDKLYNLLDSVSCNGEIDANSEIAAPLLDRYKMLMRSAKACCSEGMVYSLRKSGASDGLIYKFMSDDANFYNIGERCLMMSDEDLDIEYPDTATATVIADVRNGCICRGRQWFAAMLAPFIDAWNASPEFAQSKFLWTYTDGLGRDVTVSINDDVQRVLDQITSCP